MSRSCGRLGRSAVAQPAIDVGGTDPNGAFSTAARAAGLVGAGRPSIRTLNDKDFLLGAFIFEDVGVTAYKGAAPLISNKTYLEAAAGILAAEAYHAGLIRSTLYSKGLAMPSLRTARQRFRPPATASTAASTMTKALPERRRTSPTSRRSTQRPRVQPHAGPRAEHRLPDAGRRRQGRLLPGRRQRRHRDEQRVRVTCRRPPRCGRGPGARQAP